MSIQTFVDRRNICMEQYHISAKPPLRHCCKTQIYNKHRRNLMFSVVRMPVFYCEIRSSENRERFQSPQPEQNRTSHINLQGSA